MNANTPTATRRDRYAIVGLGLAGCALSYDALVQMALAAHIRPPLTYLFPIVIDGFIAYGVRALLVLRTAPVRPRLYGWTLFIAATTASIWANCRHAINLNQPGTTTLRLDDTTVAVLSAIAPLALAGATHLHILINRHSHPPAASPSIPADPAGPPPTGQPPLPIRPALAETDRPHRPGRRADASIPHLASTIAAAHPHADHITRAMARTAIEAAGLAAGNQRIKEALHHLHTARPTPGN
ncbi:DUF2637 domain-containing protein [Streptomyces sp. 3MP-14]|uniref:DUF2637 domain-containing protein n=1 Tax=Streptomyces mimosae TaxID=2586635 RepID=A0A5N6A2A5_9ACTN|nr:MULTISPECIES: DUF2637 domain-containing protein [Streptomyces]KAB8161800.1 DUF2637 domain-containing protein [Streptomyces mimosae]KAB8174932.1 DUF2637 domain-containing protein [Streptomyces sp. 3MP-14]